jgi:peroxiredoxin
MALTESLPLQPGALAPGFSLPGTDGRTWSLADFRDAKALVVVFMCNHCPYVIAVQDRINELAREFSKRGVALIGINPNDSDRYPADSFEAMKARAREKGYVFPYLHDEDQSVARAYDAVCTPDPYVYANQGDGTFALRYHGRIDDSWKDPAKVTRRELAEALEAILADQPLREPPKPALGCSIKWKPAAEKTP